MLVPVAASHCRLGVAWLMSLVAIASTVADSHYRWAVAWLRSLVAVAVAVGLDASCCNFWVASLF